MEHSCVLLGATVLGKPVFSEILLKYMIKY